MTTRRFLYLDEGLAAPPDPTGLPDRYAVMTEDGVIHVLIGGVWTTPGGGGGGGGGPVAVKLLPVDETSVADSVIFNEDTTQLVTGGTPDPSLDGWGYFNGGQDLLDPPSTPFPGAGTGPRALAAYAKSWVTTNPNPGRTELLALSPPPYNTSTEPAPPGATAYRVDVVYRRKYYSYNSWLEVNAFWLENDDGRWSIDQAGEDMGVAFTPGYDLPQSGPLSTLAFPAGAPVFFRDGGYAGDSWQVASFSVPGDLSTIEFDEVIKNDTAGVANPNTMIHPGMEIALVRMTPLVAPAGGDGFYYEEATGALWLYDTSVGATSGLAGQGWYLVDTAHYMHGDLEALIENKGARAVNVRTPVVLTGTIPDTTAAPATVALKIAGAASDTSVMPWVPPSGLQAPNQGLPRAFTATLSDGVSAQVDIRAVRHTIDDSFADVTVDPWTPLHVTDVIPQFQWDAVTQPGLKTVSFALFHDMRNEYVTAARPAPGGALFVCDYDSLTFYLDVAMGATSGPVDIVVTIYFGGVNG